MRISIDGVSKLPESYDDFVSIEQPRYRCCLNCDAGFDRSNTQTSAGWRETQISGFCENCYDALMGEE